MGERKVPCGEMFPNRGESHFHGPNFVCGQEDWLCGDCKDSMIQLGRQYLALREDLKKTRKEVFDQGGDGSEEYCAVMEVLLAHGLITLKDLPDESNHTPETMG